MESCGPNPARPGDVAIGTLTELVPVTGLVENFSPMPRIAPPPLGRDDEGGETRKESVSAAGCGAARSVMPSPD
ncbi:unannotated protein [freshwater metagenome]|uniref:Unannotated protein n=1 Tax=freshwater metagenome TaxID=449393 RepID=A0A6J7I5E5_9ZZZZ